ncbi:hypothetical protein [Flagellimonas algicola]|uniref:Lipoprotein n=1 Tax=Flagellimonas algicola TaxID=2583815 RepID=A0ABY2WGJ9_9FLAO|nr:hypothetical protein [Allomuricauda algicola]TMU50428.1 hypothetical protein FGG15_19590 [Allomuricauda algicola]
MKNLLVLVFLATLTACNNDDNGTPDNPADALPPATQTGEQTFGCLIDGEPFFPESGSNRPSAFYQFVRGAYTLGISAGRNDGGGENFVSIGLGALDIEGLEVTTYLLISEGLGNFSGRYNLGGGIVLRARTTYENPGTLTITNFTDEIISGTFEFTVIDNDGTEIRITDGRFDLKYTN